MVGSEKGPSLEEVVLRVGPVESAANGSIDVRLSGAATPGVGLGSESLHERNAVILLCETYNLIVHVDNQLAIVEVTVYCIAGNFLGAKLLFSWESRPYRQFYPQKNIGVVYLSSTNFLPYENYPLYSIYNFGLASPKKLLMNCTTNTLTHICMHLNHIPTNFWHCVPHTNH